MAKSQDWNDGWCAGYNEAVKSSARNIRHFKALTGDSAKGESGTAETVRTMLQGVDLYVAIPPLKGKVILEDGETIECGN